MPSRYGQVSYRTGFGSVVSSSDLRRFLEKANEIHYTYSVFVVGLNSQFYK